MGNHLVVVGVWDDVGMRMSTDQLRNLRAGGAFHGGKAERELGLTYRPIGVAIEEEVASHKGKPEYGRIP